MKVVVEKILVVLDFSIGIFTYVFYLGFSDILIDETGNA
jgi:hypothetical protein